MWCFRPVPHGGTGLTGQSATNETISTLMNGSLKHFLLFPIVIKSMLQISLPRYIRPYRGIYSHTERSGGRARSRNLISRNLNWSASRSAIRPYRSIYPHTAVYTPITRYIRRPYRGTYAHTAVYTPIPQYLRPYRGIYAHTAVFTPIPRYISTTTQWLVGQSR